MIAECLWVGIVCATNIIMIRRGPGDLRSKLEKTQTKDLFSRQLASIAHSYDEVLDKQALFMSKEFSGSIAEAYALLKQQVESNVSSAIDIVEQHPKGALEHSGYMDELEQYSKELAGKQAQLVERALRLRSIKDDVDTSFVSDYITAMDSVIRSKDLTYDAISAKYASKEGSDE